MDILPKKLYCTCLRRIEGFLGDDRTFYEDIDVAIEIALIARLHELYAIGSIDIDGRKMKITLKSKSDFLTMSMLCKIIFYVYVVNPSASQKWISVVTPNRRFYTAWTASKNVAAIRPPSVISMYDWLVGRTVIIEHPRM